MCSQSLVHFQMMRSLWDYLSTVPNFPLYIRIKKILLKKKEESSEEVF